MTEPLLVSRTRSSSMSKATHPQKSNHNKTKSSSFDIHYGVADPDAFHAAFPDLQLLLPALQVSRHNKGVYRAMSQKYGPCICKTSTTTLASAAESLRREYNCLAMCHANSNSSAACQDTKDATTEPQHHIVKPYALYESPTTLYMALLMQDAGPSLVEALPQFLSFSSLDPPEKHTAMVCRVLQEIGIPMAHALDYLHRQFRTIHADINPTNICYNADGKATLIDLGAAHGFLEPLKSLTPAYQSPEQARGLVDHRSDLYSLGVLLFFVLSGQLPIQITNSTTGGSAASHNSAKSQLQHRQAHMCDRPLRLSDCAAHTPRSFHPVLEAIIARLLVKNAEQRYQTAAGLAYDLEQLVQLLENNDSSQDDPEEFELGTHEVPFSLQQVLPTNQLIGRTEEMELLHTVYHEFVQHNSHNTLQKKNSKNGHKRVSSSSTLRPSTSTASLMGLASSSSTTGTGALIYLKGKPGVGKSALVHAFAASAQIQNPYFFSYKFAAQSTRPMHAMMRILNQLAQQIMIVSSSTSSLSTTTTMPSSMSSSARSASSTSTNNHKNLERRNSDNTAKKRHHHGGKQEKDSDDDVWAKLLDQLCDCDVMRSLVDLVPAYAAILPADKLQPLPQGVAKTSSDKLLYPAVAHLLRTLSQTLLQLNDGSSGGGDDSNGCTTKPTPICFFLDDVQWIDPGSKNMLGYLLQENVPIMTIIAFRDESSQTTFTIDSLLDMRSPHALMEPVKLFLNEFTIDNVRELLSHLALPNENELSVLADFLWEQTGGNQFYLRFRLGMMAETGGLRYSATERCWRVDPALLEASTKQVILEDVVDYCVQMLKSLPRDVLAVLCRVAMMPKGCTLAQYASIFATEPGMTELANKKEQEQQQQDGGCGSSVEHVIQSALKVAIQKNILYQDKSGFSFAHDRLQESALQCLSDEEVTSLHFYLGKRGLEKENLSPGRAFGVLQHFYYARELVQDAGLILQLAKLAVDASSLYITSGSQAAVDSILQFVRDLMQTLTTRDDDVIAVEASLMISHHQIKYLLHDVAAAELLFREVQSRLTTNAEIRDAYFSRCTLLANSESDEEAIETCAQALERLGDNSLPSGLVLPEGEPAVIVQKVKQKLQELYSKNPGTTADSLANSLPVCTDEDHNFRVEMLISCIASAYKVGRFDLYMYIPAVAVLQILEKGLTRSSGHAFSVLGFALCAVFGDNYGAEVAMLGNHVVERFNNPICTCRALCLSGIAVVFDGRYQDVAAKHLYRSYAAGRTAHDLLWACYSVFILSQMLVFDGVSLQDMVETLYDLYAYAMSDGHQLLAQSGCRIVLHVAGMLMHGKSGEAPIFHYSLLQDETSKSVPLIQFAHGATSLVCLYFENNLQLAWQIITQMIEQNMEQFSPGLPCKYVFNLYSVVIIHGILCGPLQSDESNVEQAPLDQIQRDKLIESMTTCCSELERLHKMGPIFEPMARVARACIIDVVDGQPLEALKIFDSVANGLLLEGKKARHLDIVAISQLESARICHRLQLKQMNRHYVSDALSTLSQWGAWHVLARYSEGKRDILPDARTTTTTSSVNASSNSLNASGSVNAQGSSTQKVTPINSDQYESVLFLAQKLSSFDTYDELVDNLSSEIIKHSTATRLILLMRQGDSNELEPVTECTLEQVSLRREELKGIKYAQSVTRVTDKLKESRVVYAAQDESPYCFEPYVKESGVQSIAALPIKHKNQVIALVYLEHGFLRGVFTPDIMATLALLGQHIASAVVNSRLVRDLRVQSAQLEQSHALLTKALRVKDTILSNTSHELRSPLNGIIGLNESILADQSLEGEVQQCVETTLSMAKQLLILVGDILDMSKVGEGSLVLNYETAQLRPIVEEILHVSSFTVQNVKLINNVADNFEVLVDPARIKQVLLNFVSNGIKFTPEGSVTVTADLSENSGVFTITVTDTGIGIENGQLDTIFEPFAQILCYETRNHQGTGLGLSIAKRLVELHGGRIDVRSKVGVGSSFQVIIPVVPPNTPGATDIEVPLPPSAPMTDRAPKENHSKREKINSHDNVECTPGARERIDESSTASSSSDPAERLAQHKSGCAISPREVKLLDRSISREEIEDGSIDGEPLRVLAVDDTPVNLKILKNFLEKVGMVVTTATNGIQLLELVADDAWTEFDVVLLDWMMPEMDGVTACRLLRERIPADLLPVLFLTAKTDAGALETAFEVGGTDYITKPLNRKEVIARTACQGRASRHARARFFDSIPIVPFILSQRPFWKMRPAHGSQDMFVICIYTTNTRTGDLHEEDSNGLNSESHVLDGPALLHYFQLEPMTSQSDWKFHELGKDSVTFLASSTTAEQVTQFVRSCVSAWARDISVLSTTQSNGAVNKPCVRVGVDYRLVRAHLFGERLPMLAVVESCSETAWILARKGTKHEEIILSDSAGDCIVGS